jgi:hypothetical protein
MWLDKATGGKCYMLSARALNISWGDEPNYWRWIHLDVLHDGKRSRILHHHLNYGCMLHQFQLICKIYAFNTPAPIQKNKIIVCNRIASEAAQLLHVAWLEVRGKIDSRMLSPNSTYGAYLVFRLDPKTHGLGFPFQEGLISVGASVSTRRACLHGYDEDGAGGVVPRKYVVDSTRTYWPRPSSSHTVLVEDDVTLPQRRADGWMELELADGFYNHEDDDGEVRVALNETKRLYSKGGLIVRSIEFRIKQQNI